MAYLTEQNFKELNRICEENVLRNISLAKISRWKIGGKADCIIRPGNTREVSNLIKYLTTNGIPYLVIGSTSNLLFSDEGVRAVILQIGNRMSDYKVNGTTIWVQAGKWVPGLARNVAQEGLSGIEHTAGIPGTIGGLICMNGGSQRKGIGSNIRSVTAVSPKGEVQSFITDDCNFAYRTSVFQENEFVITEAELEFSERKDYVTIRDEMLEILRERRAKFPQKSPNCGSTFVSNPDIYKYYGPPGKVIEDLGYKGYKVGGAEVSNVHANFINNLGGAQAKDILSIIQKIKKNVYENTGFKMSTEVKFVDEWGAIKSADKTTLR